MFTPSVARLTTTSEGTKDVDEPQSAEHLVWLAVATMAPYDQEDEGRQHDGDDPGRGLTEEQLCFPRHA